MEINQTIKKVFDVDLGRILQVAFVLEEVPVIYASIETRSKTFLIKKTCDGLVSGFSGIREFHESFTEDGNPGNRTQYGMCLCRFDGDGNIDGIGPRIIRPYFRDVVCEAELTGTMCIGVVESGSSHPD